MKTISYTLLVLTTLIGYTLSIFVTLIGYTLSPVSAQLLSPPMTGKMEQQPIVYYRVAFVSKNKKLTKDETEALIHSLDDNPISEKYILKPHENADHTYEIEMRVRIIFFEKSEAEKALTALKTNLNFDGLKFDLIVVKESQ
jgi:hypothetical protein